jgi:hypothetical protein
MVGSLVDWRGRDAEVVKWSARLASGVCFAEDVGVGFLVGGLEGVHGYVVLSDKVEREVVEEEVVVAR